ncbi:MAG: hypothetical protein WHX52_10840 [Anaerolineae bacterium]
MMRKQPGVLSVLAVLVIATGLSVWWIGSTANSDRLWFLRTFTARADWISVYWDGETYMLFPEDPAYEAIMATFSDCVAHWVNYEGEAHLTDATLENYRATGRLLELHYNKSVQVHTRHLYPRARCFFVPLAGTDAHTRRVFAGWDDTPYEVALNISEARFARLVAAVEQAVPGE